MNIQNKNLLLLSLAIVIIIGILTMIFGIINTKYDSLINTATVIVGILLAYGGIILLPMVYNAKELIK